MGLGGDFERLLGMLRKAKVPILADFEHLLWIEVPGAIFHFTDTGRRLIGVVRSALNDGRKT